MEDGRVGIVTGHQSDSDSNDSLGEDEVENEPIQNRVKVRRYMTKKDLYIGDFLMRICFKT